MASGDGEAILPVWKRDLKVDIAPLNGMISCDKVSVVIS